MVMAWIGYCLLISGLLALAAFACERALGHFGKPVRWAWCASIAGSATVPFVAFFAPGLLPGFGASVDGPVTGLGELSTAAAGSEGAGPGAVAGGLDAIAVGTVLGWGWVIMIVAMVGCLAWLYGRLRSEMRTWTPGTVAGSPVMTSDGRGPAVVGIRRSIVVMPKWISELEERLQRLVSLHEREHQRAGDHRTFAAAIMVLALMPWNLFMWWQVSRLRLAIEFDCDRRILERGESPRDYADALITVGSRVSGPLLAAAAFAERRPAVERRLRRMTEPPATMRLLRTLGASGVAMVAVVFVLGCPGPENALKAPEQPAATMTAPSEAGEDPARGDQPEFVVYDRPPVLRNLTEVREALTEAYPPHLKQAGVGGVVEIWLFVDESGDVLNQELKTSSGSDALDLAAADVVTRMRFDPATNRGQETGVWVVQWVTFQVVDGLVSAGVGDEEPVGERVEEPVKGVEDPPVFLNVSPVIIIDGVIQDESTTMADLQELDIDYIEIVKGNRALELYGDRATNGAIEITTNGGAEDGGR